MSERKTSVRVTIGKEEYSLRSDRSEEYTKEVAAYVDDALSDVSSSGTVVESHKVAILAALKIADDLFQARQSGSELASRISALSRDLKSLIPPSRRHSTPG